LPPSCRSCRWRSSPRQSKRRSGSKRGPHRSDGEVGSGVGDVFTRSCCGGAELPQGRVEIAQRPRLVKSGGHRWRNFFLRKLSALLATITTRATDKIFANRWNKFLFRCQENLIVCGGRINSWRNLSLGLTFDLIELFSRPIAALTAVGVVVVGLGGNGGGDELNLNREPLLIFLPPARPERKPLDGPGEEGGLPLLLPERVHPRRDPLRLLHLDLLEVFTRCHFRSRSRVTNVLIRRRLGTPLFLLLLLLLN